MVLRDLEGFVDTLLDGDRWDDNDELGEAETAVQLEYCPKVDVGLARACLHLDREVARRERIRRPEAVAKLDVVKIGQNLVIQQRQPVAKPEVVFQAGESRLAAAKLARHGELGPADFLAAEEVAGRLDRGELVVEIGFEVEFHGLFFKVRVKSDTGIHYPLGSESRQRVMSWRCSFCHG